MGARSKAAEPHLHLLGRFLLRTNDRCLVLSPSARRLLALLAVRGPGPRSDAAGVLWPDVPQARAMGNLRTVVWRIRRDADSILDIEGDVLLLTRLRVDLTEVHEWAWRSLQGVEPWVPIPPGATLELLPGWSDQWLIEPREQLRQLQLYALEAAAQRLLSAGRLGEAAGLALAAVARDPLRESAHRLLIEVHLREGNTQDAVQQFRRYQRTIRRELGTSPGPRLVALLSSHVAPSGLPDLMT
jgi:DNA-binding SARP family transcriptional activator